MLIEVSVALPPQDPPYGILRIESSNLSIVYRVAPDKADRAEIGPEKFKWLQQNFLFCILHCILQIAIWLQLGNAKRISNCIWHFRYPYIPLGPSLGRAWDVVRIIVYLLRASALNPVFNQH